MCEICWQLCKSLLHPVACSVSVVSSVGWRRLEITIYRIMGPEFSDGETLAGALEKN